MSRTPVQSPHTPRRPLLGVAILFAAGIWIGSWISLSIPVLILVGVSLLATFFYWDRSGLFYAVILIGGVLAHEQATWISASHLKNQLGERRANVHLRGVVVGVPAFEEWRDSTQLAGRAKVELAVRAWSETGTWKRAEGKVLVILPVKKNASPPLYGDELEMRAAIEPPARPMNWGQFDYRRELERQRIFYIARVSKPGDILVVNRRKGNALVSAALDCREYLQQALHEGIGEEAEVTSLLDAMLLGIRRTVVTQHGAEGFFEKFETFQTSGVAHVFAVSGLNVGLVAGALMLVLRACSVPRPARLLIIIPVLIFYTLVTGAQPSCVRALFMAAALLIGWGLKRPTEPLNGVAAAAIATLLLDPLDLFGSGFQLSFAAVIAIVVLVPGMLDRMRPWIEPDPWIPRRYISRWRWKTQPFGFWAAALGATSVAAWIGTLPLILHYFGLFAPIALIANLIVVPVLTLVTGLGMFSIAGFSLWPWLADTFNHSNWLLLKTLMPVVDFFGRVPLGHQFVAHWPPWVAVMTYGWMIFLVSGRPWRTTGRRILTGAGLIAIGLCWLTLGGARDTMFVTVMHVNGGQAICLMPPRGDGVVIDAGRESAGKFTVVPFLRSRGVDRLEAAVMSHGEAAFVEGMGPLTQKIPIGEIYDTAVPSKSPAHREFRNKLQRTMITEGTRLAFRGGGELRVLHPGKAPFATLADDNSVVSLLGYRGRRILFTAAAGETVEKKLLASGFDLRAVVIVKSQHDRETSCTDAFLDRVQPSAVIFSAGEYPASAYPREDVLARLTKRGIAIYRTDDDGSVRISLSSRGIQLETFKVKSARDF